DGDAAAAGLGDNPRVADPPRMVFLGFGKYARADRIYALEPIVGDDRGGGRRTRVWVEGVAEPIIASRTERTILHDMGQEAQTGTPVLDEALALAERIAEQAESGRVDSPSRPRADGNGSPPESRPDSAGRGARARVARQ